MSAASARHAARDSLAVRVAAPVGVLITAAASLATLFGVVALKPVELPGPAAVMTLPAVTVEQADVPDPCADDVVATALANGDDAAVVAAFGSGEDFRVAVTSGNAPCITLDDPARTWVVVNKQRPLSPENFAPASLDRTALRATTPSNRMRPEVKQALEKMAADARAAGAGQLGINNGYRSFSVQQRTYSTHVADRGRHGADAVSARPGFSEHQSGLAFDLVACSPQCGSIDAFGPTSQGRWVGENAWKYGFVVRYEHGETGTTGYDPEPWHIRYIGTDLAKAYRDGGFHTLEEFFALPDAPDYQH